VNEDSKALIPVRLEFSIGGYSGPHYSVHLQNGSLYYQFSQLRGNPDQVVEIEPTVRKWQNFKKKLDALGVWAWEKNYDNPGVCDGTQWDLLIDYGNQRIDSSGSNLYPGSKSFDIDETSEFKAFLHALNLLLGRANII
jgi:hypothetical protein